MSRLHACGTPSTRSSIAAVFELLEDGEAVDEADGIPFGFRTLAWNGKGFFVNGKETLLRRRVHPPRTTAFWARAPSPRRGRAQSAGF